MKWDQIANLITVNAQRYVVQSFAKPTSMGEAIAQAFIDNSKIELQSYATETTESKIHLSLYDSLAITL